MIFVGKVLLVGSLDENSRERDAEVDESGGTRDTDAAAAAFSSQAKSLRQVSKAREKKSADIYRWPIDDRRKTAANLLFLPFSSSFSKFS